MYENLFCGLFGQICENLHQQKLPAIRYLVRAAALQDWAGLVVILVSTVSHLSVWMMCVVGSRLWPATTELAFMFCHIVRPNTVGVTQRGNLLGSCAMTDCYCELWCMCFLLMRTTGLIRGGKGHWQHMFKLQDNADAICAVHERSAGYVLLEL